jgi:hypothetical protein
MEKPTEEQIEKILMDKKKAYLIKMFNLEEMEEMEKINSEILLNNKIEENKII